MSVARGNQKLDKPINIQRLLIQPITVTLIHKNEIIFPKITIKCRTNNNEQKHIQLVRTMRYQKTNSIETHKNILSYYTKICGRRRNQKFIISR